MKVKYLILLVLIAFAVGFLLGRATISKTGTVVYVKGETVRDSVKIPYPVKEYIPSKPKYIYKYDTIYINDEKVIVQSVDTAAIIRDYIIKRQYRFNIFDNEYGTLTVDSLNIQYNHLSGLYYTHSPVQKVITRHSEKLFTPFVSGGYSTFGYAGAGGGVFIKDFGLEYQYQLNLKGEGGHWVSGKWKF